MVEPTFKSPTSSGHQAAADEPQRTRGEPSPYAEVARLPRFGTLAMADFSEAETLAEQLLISDSGT
mgnify:CR=1 FL=1